MGKKILATGIDLFDEMGIEQFTFFNPGAETTEAIDDSVYRYIRNKSKIFGRVLPFRKEPDIPIRNHRTPPALTVKIENTF